MILFFFILFEKSIKTFRLLSLNFCFPEGTLNSFLELNLICELKPKITNINKIILASYEFLLLIWLYVDFNSLYDEIFILFLWESLSKSRLYFLVILSMSFMILQVSFW